MQERLCGAILISKYNAEVQYLYFGDERLHSGRKRDERRRSRNNGRMSGEKVVEATIEREQAEREGRCRREI